MDRRYDFLLTYNNSITGVDLKEADYEGVVSAIAKNQSITMSIQSKRIVINPRHLILVKEQ